MAKPSSRTTLQDYVFRQLGAPVLEINVADEQFDDLLDDSLQYFYERHFDGVEKVLLKYKLTKEDIERGRARGGTFSTGITTTTTTSGDFEENSNYLQVPDSIIGIERVMQFDSSGLSNGMFNLKYQLSILINELFKIRALINQCFHFIVFSFLQCMFPTLLFTQGRFSN